ncbi:MULTISPECIES: TetR/AcrR family transcriptional regulator [Enterobacter]|uniref:TetR family transcriptional regulator n=1 Tax=Enterobacter quasihormaechei TaxID=2529382 RepID=A0AAE8UBH9_9ENTR|nr:MULTISPECIES: TetR family transcriptional regulator [Enterobacter]RAY70823.1 TetR family transcriptional regulator [Enterobacter hormaechei]MBE3511630.1 TetR family transcriptional regulator [Enterobacter cloacae complex sp. I2]MBE4963288.1 TetR family transcriptional regulator [Enterobacter cloacae complex sp. P24RS]MBJ6387314.1 TetR family transcriptional regulator [Enterobacter cloacae]MBJ6404673.1 TetR family transcriptional regulator [Enterobacter cloacae]
MKTKDALIKTMQELLWTRGYSNTSPKEIQQVSGVGQGSMYHHFKGKADLARQTILLNAEELQKEISTILHAEKNARERIKDYLLREREVLAGCRMGGLAQDSEVIRDDTLREPIANNFEWLIGELEKVLEEGKTSGEFSADLDVKQTALTLISVMQGAFVIARATQSEAYYKQAIAGVIAMLK